MYVSTLYVLQQLEDLRIRQWRCFDGRTEPNIMLPDA